MVDSKRRLMWHGMFLFLLGLLTGFVETKFVNVRMGLTAHLEGVMNGIFLLALGAAWAEVRLSPRLKLVRLLDSALRCLCKLGCRCPGRHLWYRCSFPHHLRWPPWPAVAGDPGHHLTDERWNSDCCFHAAGALGAAKKSDWV